MTKEQEAVLIAHEKMVDERKNAIASAAKANPYPTDNPHPEYTGWGFTDAIRAMNCPRCGAKYNDACRTPKGRIAPTPHGERTSALFKTGYNLNRVPSRKVVP